MRQTTNRNKRRHPRSFQTKRKKIPRRRGGGWFDFLKTNKNIDTTNPTQANNTVATPTKKNTFLKKMYYNLTLHDYDDVQENKNKRSQFETTKSTIFRNLITTNLEPFAKILTEVNNVIDSIKDDTFEDQRYKMFLKLFDSTIYLYKKIRSTFLNSNYKIYYKELSTYKIQNYFNFQQQQIGNDRPKLDEFYEKNTKRFKNDYGKIQNKINLIKRSFFAYQKNNPTKNEINLFNEIPFIFSSIYYNDDSGDLHDLFDVLYIRKLMIEHYNNKAKEIGDNYRKQMATPPVQEEMVPSTPPNNTDEISNETQDTQQTPQSLQDRPESQKEQTQQTQENEDTPESQNEQEEALSNSVAESENTEIPVTESTEIPVPESTESTNNNNNNNNNQKGGKRTRKKKKRNYK
jgi:hypothetical protein